MILFSIIIFIRILLLLIGVAFITLLERLILALSQFRKGPNKTGLGGVIQPLIDGVKLLLKDFILPSQSFSFLFVLGASWTLLIIIIVWFAFKTVPFQGGPIIRIWFLALVLSLGVYGIFLSGLRGISKYRFLGGVRGCIQRVRYEVRLALVVFSFVFLQQNSTFTLFRRIIIMSGLPFWFIRYIAETNRAPFDLAEGERELIRGFNIEYRRLPFAFILVGEYGIVLCFSWLSSLIFLGGSLLFVGVLVFSRLVIRRTLPRFRYDKLVSFCWSILLPTTVLWTLFCYFSRGL